MTAMGAYRTTGGGWAAYDRLGRTWRVDAADAASIEEARVLRVQGGGKAR